MHAQDTFGCLGSHIGMKSVKYVGTNVGLISKRMHGIKESVQLVSNLECQLQYDY